MWLQDARVSLDHTRALAVRQLLLCLHYSSSESDCRDLWPPASLRRLGQRIGGTRDAPGAYTVGIP
jgi:hypothetical protein